MKHRRLFRARRRPAVAILADALRRGAPPLPPDARCALCGESAHIVVEGIPNDDTTRRIAIQRSGGDTAVCYLCRSCHSRPDWIGRIEARVMADYLASIEAN